MSVQVYKDNGRFALIDAQMTDHNGVFVTFTLVVPDFWLMAVDNKNSNKETYCAYKNCKDINVAVKNSSQSSNLPCHINDAEQAAVGVGTPRFVICQQGSDSLELGSASVGVGEDSQLDSQLINRPTLSDSSDNQPIDNPGPVIRRPLPAIAKRPPFPSTTSQPATTGVVSRPSTSANTNQRFSSGVSTPPSSAKNRQQFVIPAVNRRPPLVARPTTSAGIEDEALGENRPVLMAIEERPVRHTRIDGIENIDFLILAGIRANSQFANCTDATLEYETIRSFLRAPEAVRRRDLAAAAAPVEADDADRRPQQLISLSAIAFTKFFVFLLVVEW
ncbi:hypothetical protein DAPPUDRAFT_330901 [Daphnia pulex]|uniref:Uncharacterized protein n=1 Tax=Daphnia pulex TaxID=6669 RepID=E9HKY7_DAPPU|nr:hypothetical protein DAPPUDRAFT_330901 [Daphnia pulex]|eukprot:EFX67604.1 hypothetical protein DAPPUDRAFT_330901 [Daphnia pulex]